MERTILEEAPRCDLCESAIEVDDDGAWAIGGRGVFLSTRGVDDVRREEVPLCPSCASAIGMSILSRSEIEEEEG
jgi:hypothetical protein